MANLLEYKCPNCGGSIVFDSASQSMKCPYCDSTFAVADLEGKDDVLNTQAPQDDLNWDNSAGDEWSAAEKEEMRIYVCQSCGGTIMGEATTAASSCPYCGNPIVMTNQFAGYLKPDYVIPFKLDKKAAIEGLKTHISGKKLLPKIFKDENHINEIKGMYVPFWLFTADAYADVSFKATKVRTWSDSRYNYTETSHYQVRRAGDISFDHVPVDGSSKMPDDLMQSIEPFDFSEAVDFQTAYLSGYLADKYDVTKDDCVEIANNRIKHTAEQAFASTVGGGYTSIIPTNSAVQLSNGYSKYALYPVWLLNTTWNGNTYTFAMNGQTGKFVGDLPVDNKAAWRWRIIITILVGLGVYGIIFLLRAMGIL